MKIIVTGALGHIGSYVIRDLASQFPGSDIILIDNMMTLRFPSLFNLPTTANYRFIEGDVTKLNLNEVCKAADVVIHLAAITDAAGSFDKVEEVEANNYQATLKVASACALTGAKLIAFSSTSVYGTQNDVVDEDCSIDELKPQSPYAKTKLMEEELVTSLCKEKGLQAIICRFGTIFGVSIGMRFHTAVNKFCWQASMKLPITVWSTAYDQKRPYLDLVDASRAICHIIRNNLFDGSINNVLSKNATVREVVESIREFVPDLEVEFVHSKIMNQLSYEVLSERFGSKGFTPEGVLRRGINETIKLLNARIE